MISLFGSLQAIAAAAVIASLAGSTAFAQSLDFSYTFGSGNVISGVLTGTDAGNDFTVLGVQSILVNGVNLTSDFAGFTLESYDTFQGFGPGLNGNGTAVVTLDGSYQDWFYGNGAGEGLAFLVGDVASQYYGDVAIYDIAGLGDEDNPYNQADWSASLQTGLIPEPASLAALLVGLTAVGYIRRRRRAI